MSIPDWRNAKGGTRIRVGLWLLTEVGEGGTFTKARLRLAFPGVEQVDRRMRDLRDDGWIIHTNREDPMLVSDELRLVSAGSPVWSSGSHARRSTLSAKQRSEVLSRAGWACALCGIGGGEPYADEPLRRAKLVVAQIVGVQPDERDLQARCDRCHSGRDKDAEGAAMFLSAYERLSVEDRRSVEQWVAAGRRPRAPAEEAWSIFAHLPEDAQYALREKLGLTAS
jgi:hypothetical protein